jgi:protein ImuB
MRLWIGLSLPRLPLEVFSPSWCTDAGSVVLEQERVLAASGAARAAGVQPGMRRGGVLMLMPEAQVHERSPPREAEALTAVAMAMLQYTPQVAEGRGSDPADGRRRQPAPVRRRARAVPARARERARAGLYRLAGLRPDRARRLAAGARRERMPAADRRAAAHGQDAVAGAPPRPAGRAAGAAGASVRGWFEGIGCSSFGELRRLPRPGLQRRCGRALLDLLDAAYGLSPELYEWIAAPETFAARLELFDRIDDAELCWPARGACCCS